MHYIVGIDPGNKESAYCIVNDRMKPIWFGKLENHKMFAQMVADLQYLRPIDEVEFAIEHIQCFGMPVGSEVLETCEWIGELKYRLRAYPKTKIFRTDEKMCICHSTRANDATIRQALVDRYAPGEPNYGKGTKDKPGWFYGFRADIWQAFAVAVTCHDMKDRR